MPLMFLPRRPWRWLRILLGLALVVIGLVVTPTPVPVGLVVVTAGAAILLVESRVARRGFYALRRRFPGFSAWLRRGGAHLPARLRRVLERTDPYRRQNP